MDKKFVFKSPMFLIPFLLIILVILGVLIIGLNNANNGSVTWLNSFFMNNEAKTPTSVGSSDDFAGGGTGTDGKVIDLPGVPTDGGATNTKDQKLIKTGSVSLTVEDFDKSTQRVRDAAASVKGLVISSSDTGKDNDRAVVISIKVPADKFDYVIKQVKAVGVTVVTSSETSYDVTQTYIDLKARLKNQKALEAQLILILDKATKISDILLIQQELSNVQGEIEVLQSQVNYYDSQIDMSTINVSMKLNSNSISVVDNTWMPQGTFRVALESLIMVARGFVDLGIWILVFSPIALIPLIIYWFIKKARKKAQK